MAGFTLTQKKTNSHTKCLCLKGSAQLLWKDKRWRCCVCHGFHCSHTHLIRLHAYPCFTRKEHRAERSCGFSRTPETFIMSRDIVKRASHSKKTQWPQEPEVSFATAYFEQRSRTNRDWSLCWLSTACGTSNGLTGIYWPWRQYTDDCI